MTKQSPLSQSLYVQQTKEKAQEKVKGFALSFVSTSSPMQLNVTNS